MKLLALSGHSMTIYHFDRKNEHGMEDDAVILRISGQNIGRLITLIAHLTPFLAARHPPDREQSSG